MSATANKATLHRLTDAFNQRDFDLIDELFSPNFVLHTAKTVGWPHGLEGARKMFTVMVNAAPDVQATIEDLFAEADKVAVRWTFRGTPPGEPPFTAVAISIYRFVDGKIEEDWGVDAAWVDGKVWA